MINEEIFNWAIELLKENYPRERAKLESKPVLSLWKEYFSEELTAQEFAVSVKYVCLHFDFLPAPAKFVEYVNGGKEAKAIQEWQDVLAASGNHQDTTQLAYVSGRARVALQSVGGLQSVGLADSYERQRMERSFITVYCQCSAKDSKSLPQASPVALHKASSSLPEPSPMPEDVREKWEALGAKLAMTAKGSRS